MGPSERILPIIQPERCTGCGDCVETCPNGALALVDDRAVLAEPDACAYCGDCESLCPEGAIALPFEVSFGE